MQMVCKALITRVSCRGCRAQAIALTERHSLLAAAELCDVARARLPHASALGDRALTLAAARGTRPKPAGLLRAHCFGLKH